MFQIRLEEEKLKLEKEKQKLLKEKQEMEKERLRMDVEQHRMDLKRAELMFEKSRQDQQLIMSLMMDKKNDNNIYKRLKMQ